MYTLDTRESLYGLSAQRHRINLYIIAGNEAIETTLGAQRPSLKDVSVLV
jgi:hypothetical protein